MRIRLSLRTRFIVSVSILLSFLVGLIMFAIEKREVKSIIDEEKERGKLMAENIAQLNLQPILHWDKEGIEENIEEQIDQKLIYVVIYDRNDKPFAANQSIREYEVIYQTMNLAGDVEEGNYFFASKKFEDKSSAESIRILEIETPIFVKGSPKKWGSIKIGLSIEDMRREILKTRLMLILIGLGGLGLGILGATLLARRITGPIKKLAEGTVKISKGDFSHKIDITSQDEIGNLAQSFNDMSRKLLLTRRRMQVANEKLIQAEKLEQNLTLEEGEATLTQSFPVPGPWLMYIKDANDPDFMVSMGFEVRRNKKGEKK